MATEENTSAVQAEQVGRQLQRAREQAGLSAGDIAAAQHLRPAVIQAIESGDYNQIDSELFLKGYVRAYARQVRLDADAVIADLDRELEPLRQQQEQEHAANPLVDIERRRRHKRRLAKVVFLLLVAAIAGWLVFTFVAPVDNGSAATAGTEEASDEPASKRDISQNAAPATDSESLGGADLLPETEQESVVAPSGEANEPSADTEPGVEGAILAATESAVVNTDDRQELPAADTDEAVVDQIPAVVQTPEPALEGASVLSDEPGTGRLRIRFNADCWVQVSDVAGNRLVNSLQRDGDRIDISGAAPLRVVIGAVNAVESIVFQGEPLDMGDYRVVNNRSEFILGL